MTLESLEASWLETHLDTFPINDANFARRLFSGELSRYESRIQQLEVHPSDTILDAGAGFGQWSLAFSQVAKSVHAYEVDQKRVDLIESLARHLKIENIKARQGYLEELPYLSNTFDFIFAYGSIFLTDWKVSLKHLVKTLKPGGRLYMTLNDIGWYLYLWETEHNKDQIYDPKGDIPRIFENTLANDRGLPLANDQADSHCIITQQKLSEYVDVLENCELIFLGSEGSYGQEKGEEFKNFFISNYRTIPAVYEAVIYKS